MIKDAKRLARDMRRRARRKRTWSNYEDLWWAEDNLKMCLDAQARKDALEAKEQYDDHGDAGS